MHSRIFKVRKDLLVQKGYLEGRFGAVPFVGEVDRLIETERDSNLSADMSQHVPR